MLFAYGGGARAAVSVFRPKAGVPAFVEPDGVFEAEVQASSSLASTQWAVTLANDLRAWTNCAVEAAAYGVQVYNNSLSGWRLQIRAPADISPELFSIIIQHPAGGIATNARAVKVVSAFETNFYVLHVTDAHVLDYTANSPNGQKDAYGSAQAILWAAPVFNLINPTFILATGDEVENGDISTTQKYAWYLQALGTLTVPTVITRGNNDRGDFNLWKASIGQASYSIALGSFRVFMNDTRGNEMSAWFGNHYAASFSDPGIKYRLFGQHYWADADGRNPYFYVPVAGQSPNLMLLGHAHAWQTLQSAPYPVLVSSPLYSYGQAALLDFSRSADGWTCSNLADHGGRNVVQSYGDWGAPRITQRFVYPNDGSRDQNSAILTNSLNLDFREGRLRFLMPYCTNGYTVSNAVKVAEYPYGTSNMAVLAKVNIAGNAVTTVSVFKTPDPVPLVLRIGRPADANVYRTCASNVTVAGAATGGAGVLSIAYAVNGATSSGGQAVTGKVTLVKAGAVWKYMDDGSDQGTAWVGRLFEDGSWPSGPARLGYGVSGITTFVSYGPDSSNKYPATYCRHSFEVADPGTYSNVALRIQRDDGAALYLNGGELFRDNMPSTFNYLSYAASACGDNGLNWLQAGVDGGTLIGGINVLAAEIHQADGTNSDIAFDLELTAEVHAGMWKTPDMVLNEGTSSVTVVAWDTANHSVTDTIQIVVTPDVDDDGLPDWWERTYFGTTNALHGGPNEDFDEDGLSNAQEYRSGTIPTNPVSVFAIAGLAPLPGGCLVLSWHSVSNKVYDVRAFSSLLDGIPEGVTSVPATPPLNSCTVDLFQAGSRFYRIQLSD